MTQHTDKTSIETSAELGTCFPPPNKEREKEKFLIFMKIINVVMGKIRHGLDLTIILWFNLVFTLDPIWKGPVFFFRA